MREMLQRVGQPAGLEKEEYLEEVEGAGASRHTCAIKLNWPAFLPALCAWPRTASTPTRGAIGAVWSTGTAFGDLRGPSALAVDTV